MGEVIYGDIKQYIEEMANSLGVAAEHVYELLVRQQIISGVVQLVVGLLLLILLITAVRWTINIFTKAKYTEVEGSYYTRQEPNNVWGRLKESNFVDDGHIWLISVFVWIVLLIIVCILIPSAILQIVNPEYYAIREILDVFKGGN